MILGVLSAVVLVRGAVRYFSGDIADIAVTIQDDSYYYLMPAYHFVRHGFFTFDTVNPTYGFQPAYEVLLVVLALFVRDASDLLRSALFLSVVMFVATGVGLWRLSRRLIETSRPRHAEIFSLFAPLFWLSNGSHLLASSAGKENALAGLLTVLFLNVVFEILTTVTRPTASIGAGLLAASLVLCRVHPSVLIIVTLGSLVTLTKGAWRQYLAAALVPVAAWAGYAFWQFGRVVPTSVTMKALAPAAPLTAERIKLARAYVWSAWQYAAQGPNAFAMQQPDAAIIGEPAKPILVAITFLVGVALIWGVVDVMGGIQRLRAKAPGPFTPENIAVPFVATLIVGSLVGTFAMGLSVALKRPGEMMYAIWYLFDLPLLLPLGASLALAKLFALRLPRSLNVALPVALLLALTAHFAIRMSRVKPLPPYQFVEGAWQPTIMEAGRLLAATPAFSKSDRVLSSSSGLLGFLLPGQVINIDGLANDRVADVFINGSGFVDCMVAMNATYYSDVISDWGPFSDGRLIKEDVKVFPFSYGGYFVSKIVRREEVAK
jgi:hypothetical protein